jgi:predicted  nucleic acid-binding Zn-ribbon protein
VDLEAENLRLRELVAERDAALDALARENVALQAGAEEAEARVAAAEDAAARLQREIELLRRQIVGPTSECGRSPRTAGFASGRPRERPAG